MYSKTFRVSFSFIAAVVLLGSIALESVFPTVTEAKVFITLPEALASAFPASKKCETQPETKYLTVPQHARIKELSGTESSSALVVRYRATCDGKPAGHAYTDTHRVRTHPETLLIIIDLQGKVVKTEAISFDEPLEYLPRSEWYATFGGAKLDEQLALKRKIPFVTGASLTAKATTAATRRALAIDLALKPGPGPLQ